MALQYRFKGKSIEICMCLYVGAQCNGGNNVLLSGRTIYHQGVCILMYLKKGGQKTIT